jgi:heme-degrading monooxygenase HmoA
MVARVWRGATRLEDVGEYVRYIEATGLASYRSTPGNRGAWIMWRPSGEEAEVVTLSFWDSRQAIESLAGTDIDRAVLYPEDDRYLIRSDLTVTHYDLVGPA